MKPSHYLLGLLSLVLAAPSLAAQGFEGTMKQQQIMVMPQGVATLAGPDLTDPQKIMEALSGKVRGADPSIVTTNDLTVTIKGMKMRIDGMNSGMGGAGSYALMDAGAGMMYTVMPQQKQIVVVSLADALAIAKRLQDTSGAAAPPSTTPPVQTDLGTKAIAGVQTHGYRVAVPEGVGVVWIDPAMKDALAAFSAMQQKMAGMNPGLGALQSALVPLGFPLVTEVVARAPAMLGQGFVYTHVEVSEVKKQPVADDVFVLPADFAQVSLAKMMGVNP